MASREPRGSNRERESTEAIRRGGAALPGCADKPAYKLVARYLGAQGECAGLVKVEKVEGVLADVGRWWRRDRMIADGCAS
jgi:hypothetical protein